MHYCFDTLARFVLVKVARAASSMWCHLLAVVVATLVPRAMYAAENNVDEALFGEWVIVEMVYNGTVQDFQGGTGGWFRIEKEGFFARADETHFYSPKDSCTIGPRGIDIWEKRFGRVRLLQALYELKDGRLRIVWRDDYGERPTSFDARRDNRLTLYILKKVAK
jgi:hypothetical protein